MTSPKTNQRQDKWDFETLNACDYCGGAVYILPVCPDHGNTPFNTYLWIQSQRNMPEWECSKCHERGKSEMGIVPFTHFCPGTEPPRLDLSAYHTPA